MDSRITQLISAAEKHIASRHYSVALEQLAAAENIEPDNRSIQMIRELVKSLQAETTKPSLLKRFMPVTVDPKSPTGIEREGTIQANHHQKRIQSLTSRAEYFLSRGIVDNAFDSLMRAYLLDPIAPEVLACEKRVLPAWQKLHGKFAAEAKREWKLNVSTEQPPKSHSSLFDRLKSGKLFQ